MVGPGGTKQTRDVEELVGHLREGRTGAWPLRKVLFHNRSKELIVASLLGLGHADLHLAALEVE